MEQRATRRSLQPARPPDIFAKCKGWFSFMGIGTYLGQPDAKTDEVTRLLPSRPWKVAST